MQTIWGWYKTYGYVEVEDDATAEEIRKALADHMSFENATYIYPKDIFFDTDIN